MAVQSDPPAPASPSTRPPNQGSSKKGTPSTGSRSKKPRKLPHVGWREWLALPDLGIDRIKVKVDTGARTSSLHAWDIQRFDRDGQPWVRFEVHPEQRSSRPVTVEAPLVDERKVRPSTGKAQLRPVIETRLRLGSLVWSAEVTLVRRDMMGFRMLLGRQAIRNRCLVDPGRSYLMDSKP